MASAVLTVLTLAAFASATPLKVGVWPPNSNAATGVATAGMTYVPINNFSTFDFTTIDILEFNGYFGDYSTFNSRYAALSSWVSAGGKVVVHERDVNPSVYCLGASGLSAVFDPTPEMDFYSLGSNPVATGPGGSLNDTSLDGGNSSSHGYVTSASLPAGSVPILFNNHLSNETSAFLYTVGSGCVYYSTIPMDYYLTGNGPTAVRNNLNFAYMPNVLHFVSAAGGAPTTPATLTDFTLNTYECAGGTTVVGTITLDHAAPSGGTTCTMTCSDLRTASLPILAPPVAGPLRIFGCPSPVPSSRRVWRVQNTSPNTVTCVCRLYFDNSQTRTITCPPNSNTYFATTCLSSAQNTIQLFVNGTLVQTQAQVSTVGQVTNGLWVFLSCPSSVTVPAGSSSATFFIGTSSVEADVSTNIACSAGSVSISRTLRLTWPPAGSS